MRITQMIMHTEHTVHLFRERQFVTDMLRLAELCAKYDLLIYADEIYTRYLYDGVFIPMRTIEGMESNPQSSMIPQTFFSFISAQWITVAPPMDTPWR